MMLRHKNNLLCILCCLFLTGCFATQSPAPAVDYGLRGGADSAGVHTVSSGETLWVIAQRYRTSMPDIIHANGLNPPYELAALQRLRIPPPKTYAVRAGDSLYGISRTFSVSPSQIVRLNNLREPYAVRTGQTLTLPAAASSPLKTEIKVAKNNLHPSPPSRPAFSKGGSRMAVVSKTPPRASSKFMWPVDGPVISSYGPKKGGLHNDGINIKAPKGAPVRVADNGTVVYAGNEVKGFGNLVLVKHADKWVTAYAHMDRMLVKKGQTVKQGQSIGVIGSTGSVDSPQLHFETRRGTDAINPAVHLAQRGI